MKENLRRAIEKAKRSSNQDIAALATVCELLVRDNEQLKGILVADIVRQGARELLVRK
jgi:RecB family endonuclease NucS